MVVRGDKGGVWDVRGYSLSIIALLSWISKYIGYKVKGVFYYWQYKNRKLEENLIIVS